MTRAELLRSIRRWLMVIALLLAVGIAVLAAGSGGPIANAGLFVAVGAGLLVAVYLFVDVSVEGDRFDSNSGSGGA